MKFSQQFLFLSAFALLQGVIATDEPTTKVVEQIHKCRTPYVPRRLQKRLVGVIAAGAMGAGVINDIAQAIDGRVKAIKNRPAALSQAYDLADTKLRQRKNILVCRSDFCSCVSNNPAKEPLDAAGFTYDGIAFTVWIIDNGNCKNYGDGGLINWQFVESQYAVYDKANKQVTFKKKFADKPEQQPNGQLAKTKKQKVD